MSNTLWICGRKLRKMNKEELLEMAKNLLDENLKLMKTNNVLWEYIKEEDLVEINKILEEE